MDIIKISKAWIVIAFLFTSCSAPNCWNGSTQKSYTRSLSKLNKRFVDVDNFAYSIGNKVWDSLCANLPDFSYVGCRKYYYAGKESWVIIGKHKPTNLEFSLIPGGAVNFQLHNHIFTSGDKAGKCDCKSKRIILKPFLMCRTEVPQSVFKKFGGINDSAIKKDWLPVQNVNYFSAENWCRQLGFRLPTEVEWEFACKGSLSADYLVLERYRFRFPNDTGPSGIFSGKANLYGLYNMLGNVSEWCQDNYTDNVFDFPSDGNRPFTNKSYFWVKRGGNWASFPQYLTCFTRAEAGDHRNIGLLGFRPVKDIKSN